jgi:hypothetical protein
MSKLFIHKLSSNTQTCPLAWKSQRSGSAYFVSTITVVPFFTVTTDKPLLNTTTDPTLVHSDGAFIVQKCLPQLGATPACNITQKQTNTLIQQSTGPLLLPFTYLAQNYTVLAYKRIPDSQHNHYRDNYSYLTCVLKVHMFDTCINTVHKIN